MSDVTLLAQIDTLTAQATATAWSSRSAVDWWGATPQVPEGVARAAYVDTVSQLFHVEQAALAIASTLVRALPEPAARAFAATQVADEDRHAQVHRGYLERLGDIAPVDPALAAVCATARAWTGPAWVQVAALDVILAREVMPPLRRRIAAWPCRLFRQINARVGRDEVRHAAFGRAYLELVVPRVDDGERADGVAWLDSLWRRWAAVAIGRDRGRGVGLHPDRDELERAAQRTRAHLRRLGVASEAPRFALAG